MNKNIKIKFIILLFVLLNISQLISIDNIGQIGECFLNAGKCNDIKIVDNIAYIASEYGLIILDVSNTNNPLYLSSFKTIDIVRNVDVFNGVAALCVNDNLVLFINVSNPSNPTLISSYELSTSWYFAWSVTLKENYAFVSVYSEGFLILDISDINNPILLLQFEDNYPREMKLDDNYLYTITDLGNQVGFNIFDITDINSPTVIGSTTCPGEFSSGFEIQDNFVFIAAYADNLQIIDINNPSNPQLISECIISDARSFDVAVDENYAYLIGKEEMSFSIIDISDPFTPNLIESFDYPGKRIFNIDNNVFICRDTNNSTTYNGVGLLNIENPVVLTIDSEYRTDYAEKIVSVNDFIFVANGFRGLTIIDISNPYNPTSISNFNTICKATDVVVESDIAYVAVADSCLQIIDVSNPSQPLLLGGVTFPNYSMQTVLNIDKYGDYIYLGGNFMWDMIIVNVSNPTNPIIANQQGVNDFCYDIDVFEDNLFLAGYWGGLQIFDLVNPVFPNEVGDYPLDLALCVKATENKAFIGDPYASLRIFDTSDINNPILTETYSIEDVEDMFCSNDTLFVASDTGLHLFNVSDPYNSFEIMTLEGQYPRGVTCQNDYIFSTESFELKIYGDTTLVSVDNNVIVDNPNKYNLSNYPNPFNPITTISFSIHENSEINLSIYNIKGQKIKTLIDDEVDIGNHSISWYGENKNNNSVSSGVYFYKLNVNNETEVVKKSLLLK